MTNVTNGFLKFTKKAYFSSLRLLLALNAWNGTVTEYILGPIQSIYEVYGLYIHLCYINVLFMYEIKIEEVHVLGDYKKRK